MDNVITGNLLEENLAGLNEAVGELQENEMFDLAELIQTSILLLSFLRRQDVLPWTAVNSEPLTGDMNTLRDLCTDMKELQLKALDLKAQAAEVRIPLDELRLRKIPDMLELLQCKTATFPGIGRVQTAPDLYCSTKKGRKDEAMLWLRDIGLEEMIKESYNASSMKALIRRQLEDGVAPPDFLNVTPFIRASIVKA